LPVNQILTGDWIEVLKELPACSVHCVVTSPPYWGQRLYGWGGNGSCQKNKVPHIWGDKSGAIMLCQRCGTQAPTLGLEATPERHIENLIAGFREVRRVMRDDAVMFLNYGDKYNTAAGGYYPCGSFDRPSRGAERENRKPLPTTKLNGGNLFGLAWRLALALQADGWILRSDIIWAKALSFCPTYSGSCMPESVNGWRWERHRVKVKSGWGTDISHPTESDSGRSRIPNTGGVFKAQAEWQDCPGCPKCEPNGGLILRKGSWRPTRGHEYLFMLTKTDHYYCDMEAVREESTCGRMRGIADYQHVPNGGDNSGLAHGEFSGRNLRDVWCINPQAYSGAHYATFPEKLIEPCIKVATSERGVCPKCGAQWARIVNTERSFQSGSGKSGSMPSGKHGPNLQGGGETLDVRRGPCLETHTLGWRPSCKCGIQETVPAIVLDPFMGSGTVGLVAAKLKRNWLGIEINPDYVKNHAEYRAAEGETGLPAQEQRQGQKALFVVK